MNCPVSFQVSGPMALASRNVAVAVPSMVPAAPMPNAPSMGFPAASRLRRSTFRRTSTIAAFTQMLPSW